MSAPIVSEQGGAPTLDVGTLVAGRYRVIGLIGSGGMGTVYLAEHVHMRKKVALKLLHRELLAVEEVVARFEREAIAAGRIEHPNVVAASDFGKLADGSFYLVLEFVDGTSLRSLLAQGALPIARTLKIAHQTLLALAAAHASGVVHRDLKPDNVMIVTDSDGIDRVKVLDFGIARIAVPDVPDARRGSTKLTQAGVVMGTVEYMSPEQATGQAVDGRTDLYSLGVMLYEMIAGVVPFDAALPSQVLARQLVEEPPPLPPGTSPAMTELVFDLMQKKPDDRPASAEIVLERLATLTATPSGRVLAPPRSLTGPVLLVLGGAVLLLAVVVLALTGTDDEPTAASAESPVASASSEPSASVPAPAARSFVAPSGAATAASPSPGASTTAPSDASAKPADPSAKAARAAGKTGAKSKERGAAPAPTSAASTKRKTGPGGIYIPPPDQWFK